MHVIKLLGVNEPQTVEINEIETGQFSKSPTKTDKINKAANKLKNLK